MRAEEALYKSYEVAEKAVCSAIVMAFIAPMVGGIVVSEAGKDGARWIKDRSLEKAAVGRVAIESVRSRAFVSILRARVAVSERLVGRRKIGERLRVSSSALSAAA